MRTALTLLDNIQIASPCSADWEDMIGDEHSRHCLSCDKRVYDLSSLTAEQGEALIRAKEGTLCVRLYRRADGRVLTADCPEGLRERLQRYRVSGRIVPWVVALIGCALLDGLMLIGLLNNRGYGVIQGEICPPGPPIVAPERLPDPQEEA